MTLTGPMAGPEPVLLGRCHIHPELMTDSPFVLKILAVLPYANALGRDYLAGDLGCLTSPEHSSAL